MSVLKVSSGWTSSIKTPSFHPCGNAFFLHPHVSAPRKIGTGPSSAPGFHRKDLGDRREGCPHPDSAHHCFIYPQKPWPAGHICTSRGPACGWGHNRRPRQSQASQGYWCRHATISYSWNYDSGQAPATTWKCHYMKWKVQRNFVHVFYICIYRYILFFIYTHARVLMIVYISE